MFCNECGSPNADTAKFCGQCGQRLAVPPRSNDMAGQTRAPGFESPEPAPEPLLFEEPSFAGDEPSLAGQTTGGASLELGTLLSKRFRIERRLGAGAMGEVWLARDERLDRNVAVKLLPAILSRNRRAIDGLIREARLLLDLTHPHLCRIHDLEQEGELVFLTMEWVEGQTLEDLLDLREDRRLSLEESLSIFGPVAEALNVAHQRIPPILHRDLKPANIMVQGDGVAKVMDFGIACQIRDGMTRVTGNDVTGTLLYMSPEQFQGRSLTPTSDVYSLAATLYECLCGHAPFPSGVISHRLLNEPAPSLLTQGVSVPVHVDDAVLRALAKDPSERFPNCPDFIAALRPNVGKVTFATPVEVTSGLLIAPFSPSQIAVRRGECIQQLGLSALVIPKAGPLVLIPPGQFMMGNMMAYAAMAKRLEAYGPQVAEKFADERPAHQVRITKPLWMAQHPVTVGQFRDFVEATKYVTDAEKSPTGGHGFNAATNTFESSRSFNWRTPGFEQVGSHPVVNVSWNDATAYCRWLSQTSGKKCRLPTEAEWEYAARAGTTCLYFHGDNPDGLARYANIIDASAKKRFRDWVSIPADDGHVFTSPVGSFAANPFGLCDMLGNVWEWCADWYGRHYYEVSPDQNPPGPQQGGSRVLRGGSWHNGPVSGRCAHRHALAPEECSDGVGFRIVTEV